MIGPSIGSVFNSFGALVEIVPHKPPTAATKHYTTTQSVLVINYLYLEGTANGGAPILSYEIMWD